MATSGFIYNDELTLLEDCLALIWRYTIQDASESRGGNSFSTILKVNKDLRYFDAFVDYYKTIFNPDAQARSLTEIAEFYVKIPRKEIAPLLTEKYERFVDMVEQCILFNDDDSEERRRVGRFARVMEKIYKCAVASVNAEAIIIYDIEGWLRELSDDTM